MHGISFRIIYGYKYIVNCIQMPAILFIWALQCSQSITEITILATVKKKEKYLIRGKIIYFFKI